MNIPKTFLYTKSHEWIEVSGTTIKIGITDYAQGELGDICFIEFPELGENFEKGDVFGVVEAVKTVADLIMPVSGEIININTDLEENPELINNEPYKSGWMIEVRTSDDLTSEDFLRADTYQEIIK